MRESEIELHFQWAVEMIGGKHWKTKCIGRRGFPDRIAVFPGGRVVLVELKAENGRLSAAQKQFANDMKRLGAQYECLWSKEQINDFIRRIS